jgi:hypothetical protein
MNALSRSRLRGPLADALRVLGETPSASSAKRSATSTLPHFVASAARAGGTAAFLAELLDLRASVTLADALGDLADASGTEYDSRGAVALAREVSARLAEIDARLEKATTDLVEGRASALAAGRVAAAFIEAADDPRGIDAAARDVFTPVADYLALRLERARLSASELRDEAAPMVARFSREASRLVRLDTVLAEVTRDGEVRLLARVAPAAEQSFAREAVKLVSNAESASVAVSEARVRDALGPGGNLRRVVEAAVDATLAIFRHDRARIEALVAACAKTVSV